MIDALMYLKAARALKVPAALEVSRSGVGAHAWVFFTAPVPAGTARRLGTGLLREAMALRGRMRLASYDRLFPSQDLLPLGGVSNLIAAPLFKPARDEGRTVFVDPGTLEPYRDQWAYLSSLGRIGRHPRLWHGTAQTSVVDGEVIEDQQRAGHYRTHVSRA
jgi:hypothetical protein